MSKKILCLALAVVMLMSIFAFSTNAADLTTGQIGIRVESNAYIGMPAGEEVIFKVYYVVPDDLDLETYKHAIGNIAVAYTDGFKINTTSTKPSDVSDARTWGASYADVFAPTCAVNITPTVSNGILKKVVGTADESKGWDSAAQVQQLYENVTYTSTTGYALDPDCEIFSLSFVTTRAITADDSIGIPAGAYGASFFKINSLNTETLKTSMYSAANVVLTDATAYPGAAALEKLAGKMRVNGDDATKADLGYIGTSNLPVTVKPIYDATGKVVCRYDVDGDACGITGVGFEVKVDGVPRAATATKIYLNGAIADDLTSTAGFKFLPALTGVDADCLTSTIEMRTYVIKDGSYIYSEWFEYDAATTYSNAKAANMPAIFG